MLDCDLYGYSPLETAMTYNLHFPETCTRSEVDCLWDDRAGSCSEIWGETEREVERGRVWPPACPCPLSNRLGIWGCGMWYWHWCRARHSCVGPGHSFPTQLLLKGEREGTQLIEGEFSVFFWKRPAAPVENNTSWKGVSQPSLSPTSLLACWPFSSLTLISRLYVGSHTAFLFNFPPS